MKSSFRDELPRVYELKDLLENPSHPDAFFQGLKDLGDPQVLGAFRKLESWIDVWM